MSASGQTSSAGENRTIVSKRNDRRRRLRFRSGSCRQIQRGDRGIRRPHAQIILRENHENLGLGERAQRLLTDSGLNPAELLSVPDLHSCHHAPGRPDSDRDRSGPGARRCREGLCLPQPAQNSAPLRSRQPTAAATRSRLARQASGNALAHENFAGSHRRDHIAAFRFHSRISFCSAVSSLRRIPCQRKCQPPGSHATGGKEYRRHFGRAEPHAASNSTGIHRRRTVRRRLRV